MFRNSLFALDIRNSLTLADDDLDHNDQGSVTRKSTTFVSRRMCLLNFVLFPQLAMMINQYLFTCSEIIAGDKQYITEQC